LNQEKFISSYIELLTVTMTEAIQKNVVLQAQKKVLEEEIKSVENKDNLISSMKSDYEKQIQDLKNQLNDTRKQKEIALNENIDLKKSSVHIDTFKNELTKTRSELSNSNKIIEEKDLIIINLMNEIKSKDSNEKNKTSKIVVKQPKTKNNIKNLFVEEPIPNTNTVRDAGNF
jgi:chromosome segregation ATPase